MTVEEAVRQARSAKHCFVVWDSETGEPLEVIRFQQEPSPDESVPCLQRLQTGYPDRSVAGRFLTAKEVTPALFAEQEREADDVRERVAWYVRTAAEPLPRVVEMLERREYPRVVGEFHGAGHLVGTLTGLRRRELTPDLVERLRVLARGDSPAGRRGLPLRARWGRWVNREDDRWLEPAARRTLAIRLAGLDGDVATLAAMWRQEIPGCACIADADSLMRCFGELRVSDPALIADLIDVVERPGFFGPRYEAMIALGRIGPLAGQRAFEAIQASIYDSSDHIVAIRKRVCAHILAPEGTWRACTGCERGRVPAVVYDIPSTAACPACHGLAWLPPH